MVTDGILCAVQGMTDRFDTTEAKNAGNAIFEMLADFDEGMWEELTNSYAVDAWLSQHIKKAFISNPLRERFTYGEEGLITKSDILRAMNTGGIKLAENAYGCCGICCVINDHAFCLKTDSETLKEFEEKNSKEDIADIIHSCIKTPEAAQAYGLEKQNGCIFTR